MGTSWLLTRRLGYHGAIAYYLRGRHIGAEDALELGLVEEVHPHDELLAAAGNGASAPSGFRRTRSR